MKLKDFDGMCVSITDQDGNVFEGYCSYHSRSYIEHEFGFLQDGLQIETFLFLRRDIKALKSLEDHRGPYGKFSERYGTLEKMTVEDGAVLTEEALESEDNEHVYRMLLCLEEYLDPGNGKTMPDRDKIIEALRRLLTLNNSRDIQAKAKELIDRWG